MSNIEITLPDGSKQSVAAETAGPSISPIPSARAWPTRPSSPKVNGEMLRPHPPLEQDATLEILTTKRIPKRSRSTATPPRTCWPPPCSNCIPRPSSASARPSTTASITISTAPRPFTPDDLEKIEKKMWEIQARNLPYERVMTPKDEGLRNTPTPG